MKKKTQREGMMLTYFQPRVVLQHSQYMSATAWSPVKRTRSSACPHPTLTLCCGQDGQSHTFRKCGVTICRQQAAGTNCVYSHWIEQVRPSLATLKGLGEEKRDNIAFALGCWFPSICQLDDEPRYRTNKTHQQRLMRCSQSHFSFPDQFQPLTVDVMMVVFLCPQVAW
jgi:hypothetical protein